MAALYRVFLSGNTRGLLNARSVGSHTLLINISLTDITQGWPSFPVKSNGQFRCMGNSGPPLTARGPSLGTRSLHEEGGAELESLRCSGVRLMLGTGEVPLELLHSLKIRCSLKCIP